jgi:hypothetical protein
MVTFEEFNSDDLDLTFNSRAKHFISLAVLRYIVGPLATLAVWHIYMY